MGEFPSGRCPAPTGIDHRATRGLEEPAGAGAVVAVQLARLTAQVPFHSPRSRCDRTTEVDYGSLAWIRVAWREQPSRRGLSLVDHTGDRAIL